ncbi:MAG: beta-galactosidase, partial [Nocardioidaceae bacterium]
GVNLVTLGVFGWAFTEPDEGRYEFGWLDEVMDLLHDHGIGVDLATGTASPPPWLAARHPETLPVTADGTRLWPGSRQAYCPSSPVFRERAGDLTSALATRYRSHPALRMWHVGNEYACHVTQCWCDVSAADFRRWLRARYGTVERLNASWGTSFWSQAYRDFDEVNPPRATPAIINPGQALDFRRFSSDAHLGCFVNEREILRESTPTVPVTTNFMTHKDVVDYWAWAREVDLVSNDHYLDTTHPRPEVDLSFGADVSRGLAGGRPWLLMEHSTSAVNWQERNVAKRPGQMIRNSLQHVARGSDGAMFFQWRASVAGAEKFHSAMLPHAGTDSRVWREVVELGGILDRLGEVAGSVVRNRVAIVLDWNAWWGCELDAHPSVDVRYLDRAQALHAAAWDAAVGVDFVSPDADLDPYAVVIVPTLYLMDTRTAGRMADYVERGGHLLVTYFSGIVDPEDHVFPGGYPGALRDLLGVRTAEFLPLLDGQEVQLDDGSSADVWCEDLRCVDAETVASYRDGPVPGVPAITRRRAGAGAAWYVATRLDRAGTATLLRRVCDEAGVGPETVAPPGVEVVRRHGADRSYAFVINHGEAVADLDLHGVDLVTGRDVSGDLRVPAGGVAVVAESIGTDEGSRRARAAASSPDS